MAGTYTHSKGVGDSCLKRDGYIYVCLIRYTVIYHVISKHHRRCGIQCSKARGAEGVLTALFGNKGIVEFITIRSVNLIITHRDGSEFILGDVQDGSNVVASIDISNSHNPIGDIRVEHNAR